MATSFPKPNFNFTYDVDQEIKNLRTYRDTAEGRAIPKKKRNRLLIASWNIANLGLQKRREKDYKLIAEMIEWFDIIAIQEVNDDLKGLQAIQKILPKRYHVLFSDKGGNDERAAYIFDSKKVTLLEKVGEVAVPPKDHRYIKLPDVTRKFNGFDRNPYLAAFEAGRLRFLLVNVHLYFGDDKRASRERRSLEAYAVSRWGDLRRRDKHRFVDHIIVLGDFNLPKVKPGDLIYTALRKRGLRRPDHTSKVFSNISNDKNYDQLFFSPGVTKQRYSGKSGVFDFDVGVFPDLWNDSSKTAVQFRSYVKYFLSDHRLIWSEFKI